MNLTFSNVDYLLSQVKLEDSKPTIDLSNISFFETFALVYLGMYLRHYNSLGKTFVLNPPRTLSARQYLARMRFWERFNFNPETIRRENLLRFTSATSLNDIVDIERTDTIAEDVADAVLSVLRGNSVRVNKTMVAELVAELVDNFAQHSERSLAACAMQYYPRLRRVDLAIGDCGVGIRTSLSSNPKYGYLRGKPHHEAALKAFEPLVSRRCEGGTGLVEVAEGIVAEDGKLVLATGDGYVRIRRGKTETGTMHFDLPGVQIQMSFPERQ